MIKRLSLAVLLGASLLTAVAAPALAGKPSGGSGSSSISLAMVTQRTDGPHWGDQVKFTISTSYSRPIVSLTCSQGGVLVYSDSRPYYWPNLWDDPGIFTLRSIAWSSGAADCRADLKGTSKSGRIVVLASTTFHVAA